MCVCVCVCAKLSDTKATNDAAVDEKEEENVTHTSSHTEAEIKSERFVVWLETSGGEKKWNRPFHPLMSLLVFLASAPDYIQMNEEIVSTEGQ